MSGDRGPAARAKAARDQGRGDEAAALYREAASLAREAGLPLARAKHLRHAGDIEREQGRETAWETLEEALALYRANPSTPPLDLANALRPLALLAETAGNRAAAVRLWTEAGALYQEIGVAAGAAEARHRLACLAD